MTGTEPYPLTAYKFDNTLGALLVGGLVATALWGVTCVQTFTFFTNGAADRTTTKALVAALCVLDTFDTVLNCHILYFYLVSNYLSPRALVHPVWSILIHVTATSLSNFIVRSVFAHRVYRLSRENIPVTLWIVVLSLVELACGLVITVKAFTDRRVFHIESLSSMIYLDFAAGTSSDLGVTFALCYLLRGSRTGFERTDSLIRRLIMYSLNTGLLVALDATAGLLCYVFMPHSFIFLGFYLLLSKLYLNSYLAILNAGKGLRDRYTEQRSIHLSRVQWRHEGFNAETPRADSDPVLAVSKSDRDRSLDITNWVMVEKGNYGEPSNVGLAC